MNTYMDILEGEMTDATLRLRFSDLIDEAAHAFSIDSNYTTEIVLKAKTIKARKAKKNLTTLL